MPKKRQPNPIWRETRKVVWERDGHCCQSPLCSPICVGKPFISLRDCHIDHIVSGKRGTNDIKFLRTLCRPCHALRIDQRHRGMIAKALRDEIIPPNWRELLWG